MVNRWGVYEALKGNKRQIELVLKDIDTMSSNELKEGVTEFLIVRNKEIEKEQNEYMITVDD